MNGAESLLFTVIFTLLLSPAHMARAHTHRAHSWRALCPKSASHATVGTDTHYQRTAATTGIAVSCAFARNWRREDSMRAAEFAVAACSLAERDRAGITYVA